MGYVKICAKCLIEKKLTDFYKQKGGAKGVRPYCKECCKKDTAKRRYDIAVFESKYREHAVKNNNDVVIKLSSCEEKYSKLQCDRCNEWLRPKNMKECGKTVFAKAQRKQVRTMCPKCGYEFKIRKEKLPFYQ